MIWLWWLVVAFLAWAVLSVPVALLIGRVFRLNQERPPMPAITWDLYVEAGSYEPQYLVLRDPDTGDLLDLTQDGYSVHGVVATRPDGLGAVLVDLPEASGVWRRTAEGRIYFEPASATTAAWTFRHGYHQVELASPSADPVRIAAGRLRVSAELVDD